MNVIDIPLISREQGVVSNQVTRIYGVLSNLIILSSSFSPQGGKKPI